eukprot:TRINITY_DN7666_c0_g4_i1.p1 TRINITY_DN7666_c0_g4~~TRINITY_DN7666_c0_g4_i1.p1  ORF type:complete len:351 (-),score=105.16 TRINITY_DN7666_c0_g4_i1:149-1201(-)
MKCRSVEEKIAIGQEEMQSLRGGDIKLQVEKSGDFLEQLKKELKDLSQEKSKLEIILRESDCASLMVEKDLSETKNLCEEVRKTQRHLDDTISTLHLKRSQLDGKIPTEERRQHSSEINTEEEKQRLHYQIEKWKKEMKSLSEIPEPEKIESDLLLERKRQCQDFKEKLAVVIESMTKLTECMEESQVKVDEANQLSFDEINSELKKFFKFIIPSKRARLVKLIPDGKMEDGIEFQIKNKETNGKWKSGIHELSGGQKTLLSICFILSIAKVKGHGLYLLDECDAALDELNSNRVAKLIKIILEGSQVICVSHHPSFCRESQREIQLLKQNEVTVISRIINRQHTLSAKH